MIFNWLDDDIARFNCNWVCRSLFVTNEGDNTLVTDVVGR